MLSTTTIPEEDFAVTVYSINENLRNMIAITVDGTITTALYGDHETDEACDFLTGSTMLGIFNVLLSDIT